MAFLFNFIGLCGVACITLAFFLNQKGTLTAQHLGYHWLNLIGAALITVSLYWAWNLSMFVIEVIWMGISIYGIVKFYRNKKH